MRRIPPVTEKIITLSAVLIIIFTTLIVLFLKARIFGNFSITNWQISVGILAAFIVSIAFGKLLLDYLGDSKSYISTNSKLRDSEFLSYLSKLERDLLFLKERDKEKSISFDQINNLDIERLVKVAIEENLNSESFTQAFIDRYPKEFDIKRKITFLSLDFSESKSRINSEIGRLNRSANLNLVVGTITTIAAVIILGTEVLKNEVKYTELIPLLSHYIPRLSMVIFIEIFAFFFLKMYRENLVNIKFFNNEKTNIELKIISLKAAIMSGSENMLNDCVKEFSKTERNMILNKGQSTFELEKEKVENAVYKDILSTLTGVIKPNK